MSWLSKVKGKNRLEKLNIKARGIALEFELSTLGLNFVKKNCDGFVKSIQGRHSREACPRPDRGARVSGGGVNFPGFPFSRE